MAVEKTKGDAAPGQVLTPESDDHNTVPLATSETSTPSCGPQSTVSMSQALTETCSAAYALSAVKRTAGMQKPNGSGSSGPHEFAVLGCAEPFPM
jgi:hypothetical protein